MDSLAQEVNVHSEDLLGSNNQFVYIAYFLDLYFVYIMYLVSLKKSIFIPYLIVTIFSPKIADFT